MKRKYRYYVGIDPDVDRSGVAMWDVEANAFECIETMSFSELVEFIQINESDQYCYCVEAGWLNKSHYHLSPSDTKWSAAAKGNHVGRNHETGRKIIEVIEYFAPLAGVEQVKPFVKLWSGAGRKISHTEFCKLTGCTKARTNQEERDAGLIAYTLGAKPLRLVRR